MDTNPVENQIRPIALTRKNALFAGNEVGAENRAMLASLVATCKMADVNPVDYIAATLCAILDGHPQSRIEDLMPWCFNQPSSLAAQGRAVALTQSGHPCEVQRRSTSTLQAPQLLKPTERPGLRAHARRVAL